MKSVSLDQELKKKQGELKQQEQELSDQQEVRTLVGFSQLLGMKIVICYRFFRLK